MNILVLHRIPYHKIDYHRGIDHSAHDVTYIGVASALSNIPGELRCIRAERPGTGRTFDEVIAWIRCSGKRFERVISLSEYELMDAARVREAFGIAGALPEDVVLVRDKIAMKRAAVRAGLRVPRFMALGALLDTDRPLWSGKTVLKPLDGASSEDVRLFPSPSALLSAVRRRETGITGLDDNLRECGRFEAEEYVDGPILHFDGLVRAGEILTMTASRYVGTCLDYAGGQPLGSFQISHNERTLDWVRASLRAVRLSSGSFHLEAIGGVSDPCFLEIANRVGGADVVATVELATGVHLPSAELRILLGEEAPSASPIVREERYGWFVFPGHHLGAPSCRVERFEHFANSPAMLRWHMLAPDRPLPRSITYQALEVPAAGVVRAATSEALAAFLREMFATIRVVPLVAALAVVS